MSTILQRVTDLILASLLAVLLAPVLLGLALLLWLREGRPVFYGAERMKTPDQAFTLWKFRTMRPDAADAGVSGGDKAARIHPTGRWLRTRRLDELPQIWNILRGDIGFVGPRPPLRHYVERFPAIYARVLRSRPGVTGLATLVFQRHEAHLLSQTQSAAETDAVYARRCVPRKARLDLIYEDRRTLCFDLVLILRTGTGILTGHRFRLRKSRRRSVLRAPT